jgi:hypothetical protein
VDRYEKYQTGYVRQSMIFLPSWLLSTKKEFYQPGVQSKNDE